MRIAPASLSPRATTATPIAARSQRRINAFTQMPLLSRASMPVGSLGARQLLDAGDIGVAMDCDDVAIVEKHIGRAAFATAELGDWVIRARQHLRQAATQIGLARRQREQRVAAAPGIPEAELAVACRRAERGRRTARGLLHDRAVAKHDLMELGIAPRAGKRPSRRLGSNARGG